MRTIVVLGDSVGFGVGDEDHQHPDKADPHRQPPLPAHPLAKNQRRPADDHQG